MTTRKPRIIISSTIHDFRDLRSALRFWLRELGYEVQLSEYNDFIKDLDTNSYDACIEAVAASDIYILLLGARVGGWFSREEKVSITRAEYRAAYDAFTAGRMKLALFVRKEVWDLREDRKGLHKHLKEQEHAALELAEQTLNGIVHHRSTLVNDAEPIFDFIAEITRTAEMKASATLDGVQRPKGNWVHVFSSFEDVIDALRPLLVSPGGVRQAVFVENIKIELKAIFAELLEIHQEKLRPKFTWIHQTRAQIELAPERMLGETSLSKAQVTEILLWVTCHPTQLSPIDTISQAISEGAFCEYKQSQGRIAPTQLHHALRELKSQHSRFIRLGEQHHENFGKVFENAQAGKIENSHLLYIFAFADVHQNIIKLGLHIYDVLETRNYNKVLPGLLPRSPLEGIGGMLVEDEQISDLQLEPWLDKWLPSRTQTE